MLAHLKIMTTLKPNFNDNFKAIPNRATFLMFINVSDSCKIGCFVTRIVETFLPKVAPAIPEKYLFLPAHIKADTRAAETHLNATRVDIEKKFPKYFFHAKCFITLLIKSNKSSSENNTHSKV